METSRIKAWLAILAFFGFIGCLYLLFFRELPAGAKDIILIVIGTLIGLVKDVYSFFFGSSSGSEKKTALLAAAPPAIGGFAHPALLAGLALFCLALAPLACNLIIEGNKVIAA